MNEKRQRSRGVRIAHWVWGAIGLSIIVLLVLAGGGHPPPMIFAPVVAAVWIVGHAAIWVAGRIAATGRRSLLESGGELRPWPLGLTFALVLTGFAVAIGLVQLTGSLAMRELYPFRLPGLWAMTMGIWIVHGVCFAGLLLRKPWSRLLVAALPIAWAALLVAQILDHVVRGSPIDPNELAIVAALILALVIFGGYLAASKKVRALFQA